MMAMNAPMKNGIKNGAKLKLMNKIDMLIMEMMTDRTGFFNVISNAFFKVNRILTSKCAVLEKK